MKSPKRLTVEAVRENIRRITALLTETKCSRAGCHTSWSKQESQACELIEAGWTKTGLTFTKDDEKHRDQALAGYDRDIAAIEAELKLWEESLSLALDSLEGRV